MLRHDTLSFQIKKYATAKLVTAAHSNEIAGEMMYWPKYVLKTHLEKTQSTTVSTIVPKRLDAENSANLLTNLSHGLVITLSFGRQTYGKNVNIWIKSQSIQ